MEIGTTAEGGGATVGGGSLVARGLNDVQGGNWWGADVEGGVGGGSISKNRISHHKYEPTFTPLGLPLYNFSENEKSNTSGKINKAKNRIEKDQQDKYNCYNSVREIKREQERRKENPTERERER